MAAACASNPAMPQQTGPVRLSAHLDRTQIGAGQTATVTFRLQNTTASPITLDFSSGCQLMPFAVKRPSNEVVYPEGGSWACTMALTELTLPANGEELRQVIVTTSDGSSPRIALPRGEYEFYARVESRQYTLESNRVTLTVQ